MIKKRIQSINFSSKVYLSHKRKAQKLDQIGALKRSTLSDFSLFLSQNIKKIEGGPFEVIKNFWKKSHNADAEKN